MGKHTFPTLLTDDIKQIRVYRSKESNKFLILVKQKFPRIEKNDVELTPQGTYPLILAWSRHDPGAGKLSCLPLQLS